jgi:hypothetical protein
VKDRRGPPEKWPKRRARKSGKLGGLRGGLSDEKDALYRGVDRLSVATSGDGDAGRRSHPEDGLCREHTALLLQHDENTFEIRNDLFFTPPFADRSCVPDASSRCAFLPATRSSEQILQYRA